MLLGQSESENFAFLKGSMVNFGFLHLYEYWKDSLFTIGRNSLKQKIHFFIYAALGLEVETDIIYMKLTLIKIGTLK